MLKIAKISKKVDVKKNVCNGERQYFFEIKEVYKVSWYFAKLLGGTYLLEIEHTHPL